MTANAVILKIDREQLKRILKFQPSLADAAAFFAISTAELEKHIKSVENCTFVQYKEQCSAEVRMRLKRKAVELALSGDKTLLAICLQNMCGWNGQADLPPSQTTFTLAYNLNEQLVKPLNET